MIKRGSKVLVTGGAGYIGSHTVRQLTEAGYEVTVLDDLSTGFKTSLVHGEKLVVGDIGDVSLLKEVFAEGYESVLHFAGSIIVSESTKNPVKYFKNNTEQKGKERLTKNNNSITTIKGNKK
jgi:UDP-glucose 4-epimerase